MKFITNKNISSKDPSSRFRVSIKLVGVAGVVFILGMVFYPQKAHAVVNNDAHLPASAIWPTTGGVPNSVDMECVNAADGQTYGHGQHEWISDDDNSKTTTITVTDTATFVDLKMNVLSRNCNLIIDGSGNITNTSLKETRMRVTSVSSDLGTTVTGLNGEAVTLAYGHSYTNNWRYIKQPLSPYIPYHEDFRLNGIGSLSPGTHTVNINVTQRSIHRYEDPGTIYKCVAPSSEDVVPTSLEDSDCDTSSLGFTVTIKVINTDDLPDLEITAAECGIIRGFAKDPDSNAKLNVSLYRYTGTVATKIDDMIANLPSTSSSSPYDGYVFEFNPGNSYLEDYWDMYEHDYEVRVRSVDEDGDPISGSGYIVVDREGMTNDPCADIECGTATLTPGKPQPSESFNATTSFNLINQGSKVGDDGHGYKLRYDIVLNISRNADGTLSLPGFPVTSAKALAPDDLSRTFEDLSIDTAGAYYVRYRVRVWNPGASGTMTSRDISCNDDGGNPTAIITYKPYVKFYGEDVVAGGNYADSTGECSVPANPDASILTYDDRLPDGTPDDLSDNPVVASSVQFAAYAIGAVEQFHSAGIRQNADLPTNISAGLVFGNYEGGAKQPIGDFSSWPCVKDYFSGHPATTSPTSGAHDINSGSGSRYFSASTLTLSGSNITGNHVVYIDGNVRINSNITLADYGSVNSIPSLYVVVKGNVYIQPGVSRIDGVFIVQPETDGTQGLVYTCASGTNPISIGEDDPSLNDVCANSNLRFYGALIAQKVIFHRANGTLADSSVNKPFDTGSPSSMAEAFKFLPELYLTDGIGGESTIGSQYDYITSLPPIL